MGRFKKLLSALFLIFGIGAWGITPAGTIIGNVATAVYYDESNNMYVTSSNLVQTVVSAVYGINVKPDGGSEVYTKTTSVAYVPFIVTNTGNAAGDFNISIPKDSEGNDANFSKRICIDKNQNGILDGGEECFDPYEGKIVSISAGENVAFVVEANVTDTDQSDSFDFNATLVSNPAVSDQETAAIRPARNKGVMVLRNSTSLLDVRPNDILTYKVNFKNIGTTPTKGVEVVIDGSEDNGTIVEAIIPKGTIFDSVESGSPTTNPKGYWVYKTSGGWTKTLPANKKDIIAVGWFMEADNTTNVVLDADQEGVMSFKVKVAPQKDQEEIDFNSTTKYHDGVNETSITGNLVVSNIYLTGGQYLSISPTEGNITFSAAGTHITFEHNITNEINQSEIVNFTDVKVLDSNGNPIDGAVVEFFNGETNFKFFDTDGDGNVDTGEIGEGNTTIHAVVYIPQNVPIGDDYRLEFNITGAYSHQSIQVKDYFDVKIVPGVDFGKLNKVGDGNNPQADGDTDGDDDDVAVDGNSTVNPGETATYLLQLVNDGASSDVFDLKVGNSDFNFTYNFYIDPNHDGNISDGELVKSTPLLGGTYLTANASSGDTAIKVYDTANFEVGDYIMIGTDTTNKEVKKITAIDVANHTINLDNGLNNDHSAHEKVGEVLYVTLKLTPDANATKGERNLTVTARSRNINGQNWVVSDTFDIGIKVKAILNLILQADQSDQLERGGTTTYKHVIINGGNQELTVKKINVPSNGQLIYEILYQSGSSNTTASPTADNLNWSLKPGESKTFWVKVFAPGDVEEGMVEAAEINVTAQGDDENGQTQNLIARVTDVTTVIRGFLSLKKDVNSTEVKPGEQLKYTIVAKNIGKKNAVNITITDKVPNYTTFVSASVDLNCDNNNVETINGEGSSGTDPKITYTSSDNLLKVHINKLEPAQKACIQMIVQVK